jgi:hypothetical protein
VLKQSLCQEGTGRTSGRCRSRAAGQFALRNHRRVGAW